MSREWKPGDVAMVDWSSEQTKNNAGTRTTNSWRTVLSVRGDGYWLDARDQNYYVHDAPRDRNWRNARPLVVIDPEDREAVQRLARDLVGFDFDLAVERLQAGLREVVDSTPPRPDEPTGLGAVVEDRDGDLWVRTGRRSGPWAYQGGVGVSWDGDLGRTVVRVVSEGVQP